MTGFPNSQVSGSLTPSGCPTIRSGSDTNFAQSHRTAPSSDDSHKQGSRPPALLPGWSKILGILQPPLWVWELPGTAHGTQELVHPVYRVRSGRVLRRAGASVPVELGWPPSLHMDMFTAHELPQSPCFWVLIKVSVCRNDWWTELNYQPLIPPQVRGRG